MVKLVAVCNCLITQDSCRLAFRICERKQFLNMIDSTQRKNRRELSLYGKAPFGLSNHSLTYLRIVLPKDPFAIGCVGLLCQRGY